ncbi:unnamed protein product [Miscanthus lutarioriparius]|uniref:Uncharacterized protein n=1 Tax=Miscanthus lutarioriparius TaxID=422564 RepID=A0A811MM61_9POAL|nr:unnamed protein product [Miscanthus lutarioriparius]
MEKLWAVVCLEATDALDDPWVNPLAATALSLRDLPCERVLVCAAELDSLPNGSRILIPSQHAAIRKRLNRSC